MKKFIISALVAAFTLGGIHEASAQSKNTNAQLHYIVGNHFYEDLKQHNEFLVTLEHTSFDKWGMNFGFVDITTSNDGVKTAYLELVRELKFWDAPISAHFEWDGGVSRFGSFNNVFLAGPSYAYVNPKNGLTLSATAMYRHDHKIEKPHNFQFTGTWGWTSWNRLWTLSGFVDVWTTGANDRNHMVVVAQPQCWFNFNQVVGFHDNFNLALGTEIQLTYNFVAPNKFYALPTAALKWTF